MLLGIYGTPKNSMIAMARTSGDMYLLKRIGPLALRVNRDLRGDFRNALFSAMRDLGITDITELRDSLTGFAISMSGVFQPIEHKHLIQSLKDINFVTAVPPIITEDVSAILAAEKLESGIVIKASTGANVFIKINQSNIIEVGGWGSELGDNGSGFQIGKLSLTRILDSKSNRQSSTTHFRETILGNLGLNEPDQIIDWYYTLRETSFWRSIISDIAIDVVSLAENHSDQTAIEIVRMGVGELLESIRAAIETWQETGSIAKSPIPVILAGRLLKNSRIMRSSVIRFLAESPSSRVLKFRVIDPISHPILGALTFAATGTDTYKDTPTTRMIHSSYSKLQSQQ